MLLCQASIEVGSGSMIEYVMPFGDCEVAYFVHALGSNGLPRPIRHVHMVSPSFSSLKK